MCMTFFCWCRALRHDPSVTNGEATRDSYVWGVLTGLAYIYMVAAWGGFVFVVNMIGAHAAALFFIGRYTSKLHRAYTLFYLIGTYGAMQVPVVGWGPLKSMEQLAPLVVFVAMQILEICEIQRRKRNLSMLQTFILRVKVTLPILLAGAAVGGYLYSIGYFGPLTARVRGLFVKHTRTGNPLVDSVAEHQPANAQAYQQYLHNIYDIAPYGFGLSFLRWTDANSFLILYALTAYYFSNKMARLVILLGPVASALGGVALGWTFDQLVLNAAGRFISSFLPGGDDDADADDDETPAAKKNAASKQQRLKASASNIVKLALKLYNLRFMCVLRIAVGIYLCQQVQPKAREFYKYSHELSEQLSQPSIMFKARLNNGQARDLPRSPHFHDVGLCGPLRTFADIR